jgi:hypothetical protein
MLLKVCFNGVCLEDKTANWEDTKWNFI